MKVCCYETGGVYRVAAVRLKNAMRSKGFDFALYHRQDFGKWWKNVTHKVHIIAKTLRACSQPVLYVDADCELVGDLSKLEAHLGSYDVLVRQREGHVKERYNAGVMLFANTEKVRTFVTRWQECTDAFGHRYETCDQGTLLDTLKDFPLNVGQLPDEYNVLASDVGKVANPVLVHNKVSRADILLSSWKTERLLERAAIANLLALREQPAPETLFMFGNDTSYNHGRIPTTHDVCLVNRLPVSACTEAWFDRADDFLAALQTGLASYCVFPTDSSQGNTANYLRHTIQPKPHAGNMPKGLTLYYPSAYITQHPEELCGNAWFAAIQSAWLRGVKKIEAVCCPDGLRRIVRQVCSAFSLQLKFH